MSSNTNYTLAEKALAALWFPLNRGETFEQWVRRWLPSHIVDIRRMLEVDHIRLGEEDLSNPVWFATHRQAIPEHLTSQDVLKVLPGSYLAPPFKEFSYTDTGFRDWHVTDHRMSLAEVERTARQLHQQGALDWFYGVEAHGQHNHIHVLLTFRHPHTQDWIKQTFRLEESAKLLPVHGDFAKAKAYLDNQATRVVEFGSKPDRPIFIDGYNTQLNRRDALEAISTGENTSVLNKFPYRPFTNEKHAINMWMERASAHPRVENRTRVNSKHEAMRMAESLARGYSGKVFKADFNTTIPGSIFKGYPAGWFGHEVVVLLNIPADMLGKQLEAKWLQAVPELIYTVNESPRPPAVVYTPVVTPRRWTYRRSPPQRQQTMEDLGIVSRPPINNVNFISDTDTDD